MRFRSVAAGLLALLSSHALAFDATKATRYPSPDLYRPHVDQLTAHGPLNCAPGAVCDVSGLSVGGSSLGSGIISSVLTRLTPAQVADVRSGGATLDLAPTLNSVLNACIPGLPTPTIEFPAGVYGIGSALIAQTCKVNIVLDAGAEIRQTAGFPAGTRAFGIVQFKPAAAGSSLTGDGVINGNRAALVSAYLALPQAGQPGLYVMSSEWNCVMIDAADDITVRGLTLKNCMTFAMAHEAGRRPRISDLTILDSTVATVSQSGFEPMWRNIVEQRIGNVVNGTAIPWFSYANTFVDVTNPQIHNITLSGYQVLIRDGTSAAPGNRIGDPLGGAFMSLRLRGGSVSGLRAEGLDYSDGRSTQATWGFQCDNCYDVAISNLSIKSFYWGLHLSGSTDVAVSNFSLDCAYNTASSAGNSGSTGIWITPTGQLPGNPGLTSAFDHTSMQPPKGVKISNGTARRCATGVTAQAGGADFANVEATANTGPGWLFWASLANPNYPASSTFPVRGMQLSNVKATFNGGSGYQFNDGRELNFTNAVANNNGQEAATTFKAFGFDLVAGFGGAKSDLNFSNWSARDTQAEAITATASFVPGSAANNTYQIVATDTSQLHMGQYVILKNAGGAGTDIKVKIKDITDDTITVQTAGAASFAPSACSVAQNGSVSVAAGANVLNGSGTSFPTTIKGPQYLVANGQYLRIGQVSPHGSTILQLDTAAGSALSSATFSLVQCAIQGVPSQQVGMSAPADANISNISIGDSSSFAAAGNLSTDISVAPSSLRNDWINYAPAFSVNDGSGVTFAGGGSYKLDGKSLCMRGFVQVNYSSAPSYVNVGLPSGATALGGGTVTGFNAGTSGLLIGISNASTALALRPIAAPLLTASGQYLQYNGCMQVQ